MKWLPLLVVSLSLIAAGCASSRRSETTPTTAPITSADLTALGDSVPYGTACECTPYPQLTGADITHAVAHPVDVANDSQPGYVTADVVNQLQHDPGVIGHVEKSEAVLVEIGANDVAYSNSCGTDVACYDEKIPEVHSNLDTIVFRIHELAHGHPVTIVLLDYWSVWLGGQYAEEQGPAYVDAADAVTTQVNDTIRSVAHATNSTYVDLRAAFRGPDAAWDETHLLAPDGDHPNAEGHKRIAEAIAQVVAG